MKVQILVTVNIEFDPGADRMSESAREAVQNALEHVEENGFCHDLESLSSVSVLSCELFKAGDEAWNERPKRERPRISKRSLICGWRGMAGGDGCIRPLGHEGGHGFSDGSGSQHNADAQGPAAPEQ